MPSQMQTLLAAHEQKNRPIQDAVVVAVCVVAGLLLQYALNSITERPLLFVLYPVALFIAFKRGFVPALAAVLILCWGANLLFFTPMYQLSISNKSDVISLVTFALMSLVGAWFAAQVSRKDLLNRVAQNELDTTLRSIGDAVLVVDRHKNIAFLNSIAEQLTGWSSAEARGRPMAEVFNIINQESRAKAFNPVEKVIAEGTTVGLANHTILIAKDGTEHHIEDSAAPIRSSTESGRILGVILVFRDVTEKYAAEKKSREILWKLEATFNQLSEGLIYTDGGGGSFQMNPHALRIHGFTNEQDMFDHFDMYPNIFKLETLDGQPVPVEQWPLSRVLRGEKFVEQEAIVSRLDTGLTFIGNYSGTPVFDEKSGNVALAIVGVRDVTQQKRNEQELVRAKNEAEAASNLKTAFLANMSHEIRTPMTAVLGFTEMLRAKDLSEDEREDALERIDRSGRSLLSLIDDILDISKIESGKIEIQKSRFSPLELTSEVLALLRIQSEKRGVDVQLRVDPQFPDYAHSDPARLRQILTNLIGNAFKFTREGNVEVYLTTKNGDLIFAITDTGIGISDSDQSKLFQPFTQADESITRQFGGTGLGLLLSRRLAESLGGSLVLEKSEKNVGSKFVARIPGQPFSQEASRENSNGEISAPELKNSFRSTTSLQGISLLIAEDVPDNQMLLRLYLESAGAKQIEFADNGEEAVSKAMAKKYDIILMDIQMPVMDGLKATSQLRNLGYKGPIVALTAHAMREDVERSLQAGCNAHLTKPISKAALVQTIREAVPGTPGRSAASVMLSNVGKGFSASTNVHP